jgi:hypothetical protein
MQLDLLEQQNKKRLMMARQEQDEASRASNAWPVASQEQHQEDAIRQDSMYKAANAGVTNPPSEPLQWVFETGPNFEGRSPDGSTDESAYESAEESADEPRLKQGVDTQTPVDDEPSISKHERHPTLPHRANRPVDT